MCDTSVWPILRAIQSLNLIADLTLENLALRQQIMVLRRRGRPRRKTWDRLFWILLYRIWSSWKEALVIVQPDTGVQQLTTCPEDKWSPFGFPDSSLKDRGKCIVARIVTRYWFNSGAQGVTRGVKLSDVSPTFVAIIGISHDLPTRCLVGLRIRE